MDGGHLGPDTTSMSLLIEVNSSGCDSLKSGVPDGASPMYWLKFHKEPRVMVTPRRLR